MGLWDRYILYGQKFVFGKQGVFIIKLSTLLTNYLLIFLSRSVVLTFELTSEYSVGFVKT